MPPRLSLALSYDGCRVVQDTFDLRNDPARQREFVLETLDLSLNDR